MVGITLVTINENHTSKCSFLDNEEIRHHKNYVGKRISRGLFRSSNGTLINADVNAGYNIMKKAFPNVVSADGIESSHRKTENYKGIRRYKAWKDVFSRRSKKINGKKASDYGRKNGCRNDVKRVL